MSELVLLHSPADIVAQLTVQLGLGTDPSSNGVWPVTATAEAPTPDNAIFVTDTSPQDDGRAMVDGSRDEHFGIQVKVRASTAKVGYAKAKAIQKSFDETVYGSPVTLDTQTYRVECLSKTQLLKIGKEAPNSQRSLFTVNTLASITRLV